MNEPLVRDLASARFSATSRRAMLVALPLGALGIAAAWVFDLRLHGQIESPVDRLGFPLLVAGFLLGAVMAYRWPPLTPRVGQAVYVLIALYVLLASVYQYQAFFPQTGRLSEVVFWAYPIYVGAFLILPISAALTVALGLWGVLALVGGGTVITHPAAANAVLQYQAAGAVNLALGYLLGLHRNWYAEAQREASFDALTGLPNRRQLQRVLGQLHAHGEREGGMFAVVLFDFDDFKTINDRLGHWVGDAVLVEAARALKKVMREGDWMGRWGGEEFLVVLPGADLEAAQKQAERLCYELKRLRIHEVQLSASFGVAVWTPGEPLAELLKRVDRSMYRAKTKGKGRVEVDPAPRVVR